MTAFGPDRANDVLASCQSAVEAIGGAFSVAFGGDFRARPTEPTQLKLDELPMSLAGAGLIFGITVGETRCLMVLSQADRMLPQWCIEPDDQGTQKLNQLGVDLVTRLLPAASDPKLAGVTFNRDLAAALRESHPNGENVCLPLEIATEEVAAQLSLIWPVARFVDPIATTVAREKAPSLGPEPAGQGKLPKHRRLIYRTLEDGIRQLPAYAQSLLRVQVPVTVTLATAKTSVSKILEMGPGTILQFKKACDSNLTMEVGRQTVAEGEAVKVGDKFGLWITSMTMPAERFWSVNGNAKAGRVK